MTSLTVTNVRPWGAAAADLLIIDGMITDVVPVGTATTATDRVDGKGLLALPGLVNAHAHVDKSWWGLPWVSYGGESGTQGRIAHEREERDRYGIPSVAATTAVLREFLRHGTTLVRTHVDVDLGVEHRGIEVVREAAAALDGALEIEIVAFPQDGVLRRPGVLDLLDRAASAGAAYVGGLDPASIDRDPAGQLDGLFEVATRRGVGLDLHIHDHRDLGAFTYELIIDRVEQSGMQGKVTISHGFGLAEVPAARQTELVERLGTAGISWATVAPVGSPSLPWREMREHGVAIGLGTDGIRDLWSPFGDGDILRIALQFARLNGLRTDEDLAHTVQLATSAGAQFVRSGAHDLTRGSRGDVVLIDAENVQDALVRAPRRELVVAGGRVVAREGRLEI